MNLLGYLAVVAFVGLTAAVVFALKNRVRPVSDPVVRAVLDRLGDQVAVFDAEGLVVRFNPVWREAGGAALGERVDGGFDARDPLVPWLEECLTQQQLLSSLVCRRGSLMILGLTPLVDEFGDVLGGVMVLAVARDLEQKITIAGLTPRETELLVPMLQGQTYQQAAAVLGIGEATVKTHLQSMFRKTGCHSRHELAAWFLPGLEPQELQS